MINFFNKDKKISETEIKMLALLALAEDGVPESLVL